MQQYRLGMCRVFNFLKKLFGGTKRPDAQIEPPAPLTSQPASTPTIKSLDLNIPDEALQDEARFSAYLQERLPFSVRRSKSTMIRALAD
ncbi:hypothetical protein QA646_17720 [Rhizobium sp. CB3090]|uniref:hypothetical protein n=1 Tax=Rhizobium sp. CB3090 TaxID=3039156 RepID=UPI0024B0FDC2|nr:hypothetical protein [Rhizobium sp. CB3090]WFU09085.1 hypothetical protein QA646_17720 [Rhizobium sp. CB3090]